MQRKIVWESGKRIMFVCYGNTCRSPMAEGLAKKKLQAEDEQVRSAGIAPAFEGAQPEAVSVMKEIYGVDISHHQTRDVRHFDREDFHWWIALDAYVYETLKIRWPDLTTRLILWDIDDPFGRPRRAYEQSARLIEYCLGKYLIANGKQ
jgi:protein-tyrosine-phosphatase